MVVRIGLSHMQTPPLGETPLQNAFVAGFLGQNGVRRSSSVGRATLESSARFKGQRPRGITRRVTAELQDVADAGVNADAGNDRRRITELLAKYRANDGEAWGSLALTVLLWSAALFLLHVTGGNWAAVIFLGLCQVRSFIVFHDAAHLSFFENADANRTLAWVLQFFVNYSYEEWDENHNPHHAHFGDSTVRDASLTVFFSEAELEAAPWPLRLAHRVIRDPLLFFPLAGLFVFFLNKPHRHGPYRIVIPLILWFTLGQQTTLAYLAAALIGGALGVACFHLQHHCNAPYRVEGPSSRSNVDAAMLGSTRIPLPFPLSVFFFGIEYHHIHHYDVRVPGYRLPRCDQEGEAAGLWRNANTVGAWRAFKSLFHTQFEGSRKFNDADGNPPKFVSFWPYSQLGLQDG